MSKQSDGFTILELLIVIVVIGIISALTLVAYRGIQGRARTAKATTDLKNIETAIQQMAVDTGKWPNGCPPDGTADPEVNLEDDAAGLLTQPPIADNGGGCEWTALDVSKWHGPYVGQDGLVDPWGHSYRFDPDYYIEEACSGEATVVIVAVNTNGPDQAYYTCDDIYRRVEF